jgi:hypothetical protein
MSWILSIFVNEYLIVTMMVHIFNQLNDASEIQIWNKKQIMSYICYWENFKFQERKLARVYLFLKKNNEQETLKIYYISTKVYHTVSD